MTPKTRTKTDYNQKLRKTRSEINSIDRQLLKLVNARARLAQKIGRLKTGYSKYSPDRESRVIADIQKLNKGPLSQKSVTLLFREIMSACLALEMPLKISFLGPHGTYSEAAANQHFGHAVRLNPANTVAESIKAVEINRSDYAVVPVENSIEGAVGNTLDLLVTTSLIACGETILTIHHHLLGKARSLRSVERIAAHPQALGQCRQWIRINLPNVEQVSTISNGEAAKLASTDNKIVAIGGDAAAEYYSLNTIVSNIEDETSNSTRFLVLGKLKVPPSGKDKTSLIVSAKSVPGAMHKLLAPLAEENLSMSRLESRPAPIKRIDDQRIWEYVFFIDFDGHMQDKSVARAIEKMRHESSFLKVLGSYPMCPSWPGQ